MKVLTLMTDNRTGLLSDITYILGKSRINIEGLDVDVIGNKAIISLTVRNGEKATNALNKNGFELIKTNGGLLVKVRNNGAQGLDILRDKLSEKGIKIENAQLVCSDGEKEMFNLRVNRPRKANRVIENIMPLIY